MKCGILKCCLQHGLTREMDDNRASSFIKECFFVKIICVEQKTRKYKLRELAIQNCVRRICDYNRNKIHVKFINYLLFKQTRDNNDISYRISLLMTGFG